MIITKKTKKERKERRIFWAFLAPAGIFIGIFSIYPLISTFILSFYKYNAASGIPRKFNGFGNYIREFTHPQFLNSLKITIVYTAVGVLFTMLFGFILALLLNKNGIIFKVLRGVALMPYLISSVALTVAWQIMYNSNFGLFNMVLNSMGFSSVNWLGDPKIALYSIVVTDIWQFTPFVMILVLAGMQGISPEYYEAAPVDGASKSQILFYITIPLMRKILITILIMRIIDTFKTFEKPKILTNGGPGQATELISLHVYKTSFAQWEFGYGATGAVIIAAIIALLTIFIIKLSNMNED